MLSQKLPWFGKLGSRKEVASSEAEALWYAYQNQQLSLVREVSLAYYEYGYAQEAIRLTEENRNLLEKLEPIVEEKVKGGADLNALLRLKVEIGKVDDRLQTLKQKRVAQSAKLGELPRYHARPELHSDRFPRSEPGQAGRRARRMGCDRGGEHSYLVRQI